MKMTAMSSQTSEIYWAVGALSVGDVMSKFNNKEVVASLSFSSCRDPQPVHFIMFLEFGIKEGWLGVRVRNTSGDVTLKKLKFTLSDSEGKTLRIMESWVPKVNTYGWSEFHKTTDPANVVWRCTCEVEYEGSRPTVAAVAPVAKVDTNVGEDFLKLLEAGNNSDVTFFVDGEKIKAHKTVLLARSAYFTTMFNSDMRETASGEIEVPDVDPDAFRGLLEYLYGGVRPKSMDKIAMNLFVIADKYGLMNLRDICESSIISNLGAGTVVDALVLADKYDREELLSRAKVVFKANLNLVQRSKECREKLQQRPSFLFDLLVQLASQYFALCEGFVRRLFSFYVRKVVISIARLKLVHCVIEWSSKTVSF